MFNESIFSHKKPASAIVNSKRTINGSFQKRNYNLILENNAKPSIQNIGDSRLTLDDARAEINVVF